MIKQIRKSIIYFDINYAKLQIKYFNQRKSVTVLYFHKIFQSEKEVASSSVDPQQSTTIRDFENLTVSLLKNGYIFIDPNKLNEISIKDNNYVLYTFDEIGRAHV